MSSAGYGSATSLAGDRAGFIRRTYLHLAGAVAAFLGIEALLFTSGAAEQIELWIQVLTGMELEADGGVRVLDAATWQQRRLRLQDSGFQEP